MVRVGFSGALVEMFPQQGHGEQGQTGHVTYDINET